MYDISSKCYAGASLSYSYNLQESELCDVSVIVPAWYAGVYLLPEHVEGLGIKYRWIPVSLTALVCCGQWLDTEDYMVDDQRLRVCMDADQWRLWTMSIDGRPSRHEDRGHCQWMDDQVDNKGKSSCFKVVCSSFTDSCGTTSFVLGVSVGMVLPDHWNVRNVGVSSHGHLVYQVNSIYGLLRRAVI